MADDWMKLELGKPGSAKVLHIANALRVRKAEALGMAVTFWAWAHKQTVDGRLPGVTRANIDKDCGRKGFAAAMEHKDVQWLSERDGCLFIPEWEKHNGEGAKARAQTAKRVGKHRNAGVTESSLHLKDTGVTRQTDRQTVRQEGEEEKTDNQAGPTVFLTRSAEQDHCLTCLTGLTFSGKPLFDHAAAGSIAKNIRCTYARIRWALSQAKTRGGKIKKPAAYLRSLIEGQDGPAITLYPEDQRA